MITNLLHISGASSVVSPLDLSSGLLPASLPEGDPETFALPVFLEEPAIVAYATAEQPALLHCRAAHASQLRFKCNGEAMRLTNETEGWLDESSGSRYRAVSLRVDQDMVCDIIGGNYTCRCLATSDRGTRKSRTATVLTACKLRTPTVSPPRPRFSSQSLLDP
jgi:leucine-rich repeat transmembrane protein FLRT